MDLFAGLGIDIRSILIYAINFGIIVWVIAKFFSGPIISSLEKRATVISDNLSESEKLKKEIQKQRVQMQEEKVKYKAEFDKELLDLKQNMSEERTALVQEMLVAREKLVADADEDIQNRKEKIFEDSRANIAEIIQKSLAKILSTEISKEVVEESVDNAWKEYGK